MKMAAHLLQMCRILADVYAVCVKVGCGCSGDSNAPVGIPQGVMHRQEGCPGESAVAEGSGQSTQQGACLLQTGVEARRSRGAAICPVTGWQKQPVCAAHAYCSIQEECSFE